MKLPRITLNLSTFVNAAGILVALYLLVVLAETIKLNHDLNLQVANLQAETALLQEQKAQLNNDITYYNTSSFRDREARSKLGLQLPGESAVIIAHPSPSPTPASPSSAAKARAKSRFSDWLDFLFGRRS
jgi:cell division protein FtsB